MDKTISLNFEPTFRGVKPVDFEFGNIATPYGCNNLYFTKGGVPYFIISGEIHYSRYDNALWEKEILKMKATGINCISTYIFWNVHEIEKGVYDYSGDKNIKEFVRLCKIHDMPIILRIGPWCHGEMVYGGLPKYINKMPFKRSDNPTYLEYVEKFWHSLYQQVAEYCDGETVMGIQIENEYTGKIDHLLNLRKLAEKVGFKTAFFTMTLWPTNTATKYLLPLVGGYPEAPWHWNKRPLQPSGRYAISSMRSDGEIGTDWFKEDSKLGSQFDDYPFAGCEIGCGNQVSQHRRPIIADMSGYTVPLVKFASGVNWLGYYMYHGTRNPNDRLWQESRKTGYPNDMQIIDYDFQAPIDRYGDIRKHGKRLTLLHAFISTFDDDLLTKEVAFANEKSADIKDISLPQCSIRVDENLSGYCFFSTFDKQLPYNDLNNVQFNIRYKDKSLTLPSIDIKAGIASFFPFNMTVGGTKVEYILAQPITKDVTKDDTKLYFAEIEGVQPKMSIGGIERVLPLNEWVNIDAKGKVKAIILPTNKALDLYRLNDKVVYSNATLYAKDNKIMAEMRCGEYVDIDKKQFNQPKIDIISKIQLKESHKENLPYNHYLFSYGKKKYYKMTVDKSLLTDYDDVEIVCDMVGVTLQVFSGRTIVNDYFNIDGKFVFRLSDIKKYLVDNNVLTIKVAPATAFGMGNVYNEIDIPRGITSLKVAKVNAITFKQF